MAACSPGGSSSTREEGRMYCAPARCFCRACRPRATAQCETCCTRARRLRNGSAASSRQDRTSEERLMTEVRRPSARRRSSKITLSVKLFLPCFLAPAHGAKLLGDSPGAFGTGRSPPRRLALHRAHAVRQACIIRASIPFPPWVCLVLSAAPVCLPPHRPPLAVAPLQPPTGSGSTPNAGRRSRMQRRPYFSFTATPNTAAATTMWPRRL